MIAIGLAAKQSGVSIETIRYYEREGIVPKPGRAANGRRVYSPAEVGRLRFIKRCRDLGFCIADARQLLALSEGEQTDCTAVQAMGSGQLTSVREKIHALQQLEAALMELTANCKTGSTQCPMLENLMSEPG